MTGALAAPVLADAPKRVVSINLCTDQLAMLVAAPGQLHSVSRLAADPHGSAMAEEARRYTTNRGLAEEIYLMRPDLVVGSSFTHAATVDMLRRLDIPVVLFEPAYGLDDVRAGLLKMGEVLGQETKAHTLIADYDDRLYALRAQVEDRPSAAMYYANGYTSGDRTLAGEILVAAGFENAAARAGYPAGGFMPLEVLAVLDPDALLTSTPYPGASRSEEILEHPVVRHIQGDAAPGKFTDHDWVCGTPFVLRAIEELADLRRDVAED